MLALLAGEKVAEDASADLVLAVLSCFSILSDRDSVSLWSEGLQLCRQDTPVH